VHEAVANYHSLLLYQLRHPEQSASPRDRLSRDYQSIVLAVENALGPIADPRVHARDRNILYVLTWTAMAALNLPYDPRECALSRLRITTKRLRRDPPDRRFWALLAVVRQYWDSSSPLSNLIAGEDFTKDVAAAQAELFSIYRAAVPDVVFQDATQRPTLVDRI
jgi:hypothetical protein